MYLAQAEGAKFDVMIVDEASMIDIELMLQLITSLPAGCSLVLVGDADQLPHIYDRTQADWPEAKYAALPNKATKDLLAFKQLLNLRNAYVILVKKCQGHKVEHLIKDITPGRPRAVLDRIHKHFYPNDAAGQGRQNKKFLMSTMSNTNTNITGWVKHVDQQAAILLSVGGQCDDSLKLTVFLDGLLMPQFEKIKHTVEQMDNCDYGTAVLKVSNYATNNGLEELCRAGAEPDARVFFGEEKKWKGEISASPSA